MREENIEKMNFKELRAEVQLLRDELAIFKRKYEDAIYNLDSSNFGKSFTVEQNNMKAQIKFSADEIKTKVSKDDFAEYSEISQTAKAISTLISKNVNLSDAVVATALTDMTDTSKLYYIQDAAGKVYYYYNTVSNLWEVLSGNSINSIFEQTSNGFKFKGGVQIDGNQVVLGNLTLGGNITWNIQNSPVQTRYSADSASWHSPMIAGDMYMQMSFDGGVTWSDSVKVVGTDGKNGANGSNADVTPENVFNALTDSGAQQGIFAAFVNNDNKIYINAEYLATKIAEVADAVYLGSYDTNTQQKHIYFNNEANIHTYETGVGQNGLAISANGFQIWMKPSEIKFTDPKSGSFSAGSITLEDYVTQYGGSATAVFG